MLKSLNNLNSSNTWMSKCFIVNIILSHDLNDMHLVKDEIDHWSEVEDKAGVDRSKENVDSSPYFHHSWSFFRLVCLGSPLDLWLVFSAQDILQITVIVNSNDIRVVNVVNCNKNCHGKVTIKHRLNSLRFEECDHIG